MAVEEAPPAPFFVAGGTVPPGSPSYVERAADRELLDALLAGEYAYVLNSRQMGKSSLAVRTIARLNEVGVRTAFVDLTRIGGATVSPEQWYAGLLLETGRALGLRSEAAAWLKEHRDMGPPQRLLSFLNEGALARIEGSVVLMIDEIDAVRSLPFSTDELFAGLRQLHNGRASDAALRRLTVCLLGAALPSDLIRDPRATPFNVGRRVELRDFTPEEARPFATVVGEAALARVLHWTGGHPFLTQALCAALSGAPLSPAGRGGLGGEGVGLSNAHEAGGKGAVDALVRSRYLDARARDSDTNLADVGRRLLGEGDPNVTEEDRATTLSLYDAMLRGRPVADDEANPSTARIKMSGVARIEEGKLKPRNRIYATVFDGAWVRANLPGAELRRQKRAFWRGALRTGLVSAAVLAVVSTLAVAALKGANEAKRNAKIAADNAEKADRNAADARRAEGRANDQANVAKAAQKDAETQKGVAQIQRDAAKKAQAVATKSAAELRVALARQRVLSQQADASAREATAEGLVAQRNATEATAQRNSARESAAESLKQRNLALAASTRLENELYENMLVSLPPILENGRRREVAELIGSEARQYRRGWEWGYWNRITKAAYTVDPGPLDASFDDSGTVNQFKDSSDFVLTRFKKNHVMDSSSWRIDGRTGRTLGALPKDSPTVKASHAYQRTSSGNGRWKIHEDAQGRLVREDLRSGALLPLTETEDPIFYLSEDGGRYVTVRNYGDVSGKASCAVWDAATGRPLVTWTVKRPFRIPYGLTPDDRALFMSYQDEARHVVGLAEYDYMTGKVRIAYTIPFTDEKDPLSSGFISLWTSDGRLVFKCGPKIAVFRVGDPRPALVLESSISNYSGLSASADGRWLMASKMPTFSSGDSPLYDGDRSEIWDLRSGTLAARVPLAGVLVGDGKLFANAGPDSTAGIDWRETRPYEETEIHETPGTSTIFTSPTPANGEGYSFTSLQPNGDLAIGVLRNGKSGPIHDLDAWVASFDPQGILRRRYPAAGEMPEGEGLYLDGPFLLARRRSGAFEVRRLSDLGLVATLVGSGDQTPEVSPDGRFAAWVDEKHVLHLVTLASGVTRRIPTPDAATEPRMFLDFSPDGTKLFGHDAAGGLLWDTRTPKASPRLSAPPFKSWSPSGRFIFTQTNKGILEAYDLASKKRRIVVPADAVRMGPFAVSPDERLIACTGKNLVEIRSFTTGRLLFTLDTERDHVFILALAFSPDGHRLSVLYFDGKLRVFSDGR